MILITVLLIIVYCSQLLFSNAVDAQCQKTLRKQVPSSAALFEVPEYRPIQRGKRLEKEPVRELSEQRFWWNMFQTPAKFFANRACWHFSQIIGSIQVLSFFAESIVVLTCQCIWCFSLYHCSHETNTMRHKPRPTQTSTNLCIQRSLGWVSFSTFCQESSSFRQKECACCLRAKSDLQWRMVPIWRAPWFKNWTMMNFAVGNMMSRMFAGTLTRSAISTTPPKRQA